MKSLRIRPFWEEAPQSEPLFFQPPTGGTAGNGKPIYSWDQAAAQITRDGVSWGAALGQPVTITYAFRSSVTAAETSQWIAGVSGFAPFNATQITAAEEMLHLWSEVANINFVRVGAGTTGAGAYSNNAQILFGDFTTGPAAFSAFTFFPPAMGSPAADIDGNLWVNVSRNYDANPAAFPLGAHILAHEIGHALGLNHPGNYNSGANGGATYSHDAQIWQDTAMFSNMSYFDASFTGGDYGSSYALAPQMLDIAAIQRLYGVNISTRTGDTTYGFHANAGDAVFAIGSAVQTAIFCIWDAGGNDTLDLSGYSTNSDIDLRPEAFSSAGPDGVGGVARYNISIARGVSIESAIGGSGNDTMTGNDIANHLTGNGGNDTLIGGAGADALDGGTGLDTASYAGSSAAVTIDLKAGTGVGGDAQGDTLISIENVIGSGLNDTFLASSVANAFNGGLGVDTVSYASSAAGVTINLATGVGAGGDAQGDTYTSIENVMGSNFADTFVSNAAANAFVGGGGSDTISYANSTAGVIVDMGHSLTWDGSVNDTISGIENIVGSAFNDQLWGDSGDNIIDGGSGGADVLAGFGGFDTVTYANSATGVIIDLGSGASWDGVVNDQLFAFHGAIGSSHNDDFRGTGGVDVLDGGAGADLLLGNDDADTFVFHAHEANGDTIVDFAGQGPVLGDNMRFIGYGTAAQGASFVQLDATHWQINSADGTIHDVITLANGASVDPTDYIFATG